MSDILREWLIHQLRLDSLHPKSICSRFQNGVLIGKLLRNYNIVSSKDVSQLINEDDEEIKKMNFHHLKVWLNLINISLDNDTIDGIISGQKSTIFGFLYRLCFQLESPNNLNLIAHAKQLYESIGSYSFLNNSNTFKDNSINLPHKKLHSQKCITYDICPGIEKCDGRRNTIFDKINDFECSLSRKLHSWSIRGDQSCMR